MKRILAACAMTLIMAAVAADSTPGQGPGWTGITDQKAVIAARQLLMEHMEILMKPIDTITVGEVRDVDELHSNAVAISAMLYAFPHLFPPTTNLYGPKVQDPATLALPSVWENFPGFYKLATAAATAAEELEEATGDGPLRAASLKLRASCDACHALFLRKYEPPKVQESDAQFDFDSVLPKK